MRLEILDVPDCPGAAALKARLAPLAERHPDIEVIWQVVTTEDQARAWGMAGSPTLLIDGDDGPAQALSQDQLAAFLAAR
jgi:hypothetical protein